VYTTPSMDSHVSNARTGSADRILVVDDNEDLVEMLSAVLSLEGYDPIPAYNGHDAIEAMKVHQPHLVLLDRALPDSDGLDVCARIKAVDPMHFLPVIMVTAKAHRDDKLAGLAMGVDDYITKPFDMDELVAKVRVMMRIKSTEDKLRQRTEELAKLHEAEKAMVKRLTELDSLKSQFIATASHELRTPLSIIKGFTNLLLRRDDFGFDRPTEQQYLQLIDSQVNALTGLVDDMLSASRIESGRVRLQRERVELLPMIKRVLHTFSVAGEERHIDLAIEASDSAIVYADPQHAEQVFVNLMSNAVKYSYDGGVIRVSVEDGPDQVKISVRDRGVGIARDQFDQLFTKFTRLENPRTVEAGGTGLGLFIARNWVEANGGQIWAESVEGEGTVFSFTLPRFREGVVPLTEMAKAV
jgi:two-component system, sensor histidine kinase and response regulator